MVSPRKTSSDLSRSRVSGAIVTSALCGDQIDLSGSLRVERARLLPSKEDYRNDGKEVQSARNPHREAAEHLIFERRQVHHARGAGVNGIEDRARVGDR